MKWDNVIGLALLAYLISMNVFAQEQVTGVQSTGPDSLNIVDDGGSLKVAPSGSRQTSAPKLPLPRSQNIPGRIGSDSADLRSDGSVRADDGPSLPPGDSPPLGDSPPSGEMQMPSAPNESMVPETPSQESVPAPEQGSMQN